MYKIVAVSDSKHAKFYESSGLKINGILKVLEADDLGIHHGTKDPKDAFCGGHGTRSHAFTSHTDPHELDRDDFSKAVIKELEMLCDSHDVKEIILVSPAKMLGDLRSHLSHKLKEIGIREVIKDLTHASPDKIEEIVFEK